MKKLFLIFFCLSIIACDDKKDPHHDLEIINYLNQSGNKLPKGSDAGLLGGYWQNLESDKLLKIFGENYQLEDEQGSILETGTIVYYDQFIGFATHNLPAFCVSDTSYYHYDFSNDNNVLDFITKEEKCERRQSAIEKKWKRSGI